MVAIRGCYFDESGLINFVKTHRRPAGFSRRAILFGAALLAFGRLPTQAALHVLQFTVAQAFNNNIFYLDDASLNGKPTARLTVTQRYVSASNDHPIGVWFDASHGAHGMWGVFNEDEVNFPTGAAFNVLVGTLAVVHAGDANSTYDYTFFSTAAGQPRFDAPPPPGKKPGHLFFTHHPAPFKSIGSGVRVRPHQSIDYLDIGGHSPAARKWNISN